MLLVKMLVKVRKAEDAFLNLNRSKTVWGAN